MNALHRLLYTVPIAVLLLGTAAIQMQAQPDLQFTRLINNWPTIECYFKVTCDTSAEYPTAKQYFEVTEDGVNIDNFTLWCPDPRQRCAISVALVFDASGSMDGAGNAAAKAGGNAFIDLMDGIVDEAAVIWFNSLVNVELGMTTNKVDLHDAVNALPANGGTSLWDGIYVGLQELILSGSNPCRAVIAVSDGADQGSTHSPDAIIALANRNRVRVFTVGIGSAAPAQLQAVANGTGGTHYTALSASVVADIYQQISTVMFQGFQECLITYPASCKDGSTRNVELTLKGYCHGGTDKESQTFTAPLDPTTYTPVDIAIGDVEGNAGTEVDVPILLNTPISPQAKFGPMNFELRYDETKLQFVRVDAPAGTLLDGIQFSVIENAGRVQVSMNQATVLNGSGVLAKAVFVGNVTLPDSTETAISIESWDFLRSCFTPVLENGVFLIRKNIRAFVYPLGHTVICEGDSVKLQAADGFTNVEWSTGATGPYIWVSQAGTYSAQALDNNGQSVVSEPIVIYTKPLPTPVVSPAGLVTICGRRTVTLTAPDGYLDYLWSHGPATRKVDVDAPGIYSVSVLDSNGCWGASPDVEVLRVGPDPQIQGPALVCPGTTEEYVLPSVPGYEYTWGVIGGNMPSGATANLFRVEWRNTGRVFVRVYDSLTLCEVSDTLEVEVKPLSEIAKIQVEPANLLCPDEKATLTIPTLFGSYRWSNGETTPVITTDENGMYYCQVTLGSCTGYSDTVHISQIDSIPTTIYGRRTVCQGEVVTYTVYDMPGMFYSWRVEHGTIVAKPASHQIEIRWDDGVPGKLFLSASNGRCRDSAAIDISVTPSRRPAINQTGLITKCTGDTLHLAAEAGFSRYEWSNGDTAQTIIADAPGMYFVRGIEPGGCSGISDTVHLALNPLPDKSVTVQDDTTFLCEGDTVRITAREPNATYRWSNGSTARTLYVTVSGVYTVTVTGTNGCTNVSDPVSITIYPRPGKPVITRNGDLLTCSVVADTYQWYNGGTAIPGATARTYTMTGAGVYTVTASNASGCSNTSDPFTIVSVGEYAPGLARAFTISPNPSNGAFEVALDFAAPAAFSLRIVNALGQSVYTHHVNQEHVSYRESISLQDAPAGVYFFLLESGTRYDVRKLVVR